MALIKYKELLALAKEKVNEALAPLRAHEMKKKAELEMAKLEGTIAEKEQAIQQIASTYPIDFDALINAMDRLDVNKRRLKQFDEIIKEMF